MKTDTKLSHLGRKPVNNARTVNVPMHRASTVLFDSLAHLRETRAQFERDEQVPTYGTFNMPQTVALENAVAEIEGGYRAVTFPSGLAAVAGALLACVKSGDNVLMTDSCYNPARIFCENFLSRMGVTTTFYDPLIGADIAKLIQSNTTVVYVESPGSHTFEIQDIPAIAKAAHEKSCTVIMDNAWATGLLFNAFEHGVDLVVQPATKYYAAHSDVLIGLVIANESHWSRLKQSAYESGQRASPDDCFLTLRGMRTMSVRLRQHAESTMHIARWLQTQPQIARVLYPALESDPGYALWKRDFKGATGLLAIELKPCSETQLAAMMDGFKYFGLGYSWGGFESLAVVGYWTRNVRPWQGGSLIRLQIGLEDADDLVGDLKAGLARLDAAK
jgi:cysteine-S-conjugate beta-lyase